VLVLSCLLGLALAQTCPCVFLPPRQCNLVELVSSGSPSTCTETTTSCVNCQCDAEGSYTCAIESGAQRYFFLDDSRTTCALETVQAVICPTDGVATVSCSNSQQLPWGTFTCVISASDFPSSATVSAAELGIYQFSTATLNLTNEQDSAVTGTIFISIENFITDTQNYFTPVWPDQLSDSATLTLQPSFQQIVTLEQSAQDVRLSGTSAFINAVNSILTAGSGSVDVSFNVAFSQAIGSFEGGVTQAFSTASFVFSFAYTS